MKTVRIFVIYALLASVLAVVLGGCADKPRVMGGGGAPATMSKGKPTNGTATRPPAPPQNASAE